MQVFHRLTHRTLVMLAVRKQIDVNVKSNSSLLVDAIFRRLTEANDSRVRKLSSGEPEASVMASLLALLSGVSITSDIRYLARERE